MDPIVGFVRGTKIRIQWLFAWVQMAMNGVLNGESLEELNSKYERIMHLSATLCFYFPSSDPFDSFQAYIHSL